MVSIETLNKTLLLGVLLIAASALVLSYPASTDDEQMLNDEYDYDTDNDDQAQQNPSSLAKASPTKPAPPAQNMSVTVTGILGKDVKLKCLDNIKKDKVVLWYFNGNMIATGNSVLLPNFSLNPSNFELTILKSSPQSAGDYYCQVEPEKIRMNTKVVLGDHSLDVITPESSTSGSQSSLGRGFALLSLLTAALLLTQLKH